MDTSALESLARSLRSTGTLRGRGRLGLQLADLVADRGGALELLALDRALQLVVQPLDLARRVTTHRRRATGRLAACRVSPWMRRSSGRSWNWNAV